MELIFIIISLIFTFILPMLSLPLNLFNCIVSKKYKKVFAFFTALSLALMAYVWKPDSIYDLYRWHIEVRNFSNYDINKLINFIKENYEPINYFLKYFCAKVGDKNLLQFIVVLLGYYTILWIVSDYTMIKKYNNFSFAIVSIFSILCVGYINFISGLWFNFAIIIFSLGIYLNYFKKSKWIHWLFYFCAICIHISTIYLLIIRIIVQLVKINKYRFIILVSFLGTLLVGGFITLLNSKLNVALIHYIYDLYVRYFINGGQYSNLHTGINLYEAVIKILICVILIYIGKKIIVNYDKCYLIFLSLIIPSIIAMKFSASVIIVRYSFFIVLITIPLMLDFLSSHRNKKYLLFLLCLFVTSLFLVYRQYKAITKANLMNDINNNILTNIVFLDNEKK